MSFLSVIIGGGVVGLPYSFYHTGIPLGIFFNVLFGLMTICSSVLLLKAKDLSGGLTGFQLMIIYFIVTGDILASFASEFTGTEENAVIYTSRAFYVFITNLYATVRSMKNQSTLEGTSAVAFAIFISMGIYVTLSIMGIYMFGSSIKHDLLDSIGNEKYTWATIVLCITFFCVLIFHIPFVFFFGRENFLIVIDEIDRRSISKSLDRQIYNINIYSNETLNEDESEEIKPAQNPTQLAIMNMKKKYQYGGTILIYILEIIGAMFIKDLGIIFSIGAAISGSATQFIIPGYFYVFSDYKFGTQLGRHNRKCLIFTGYLFMLIGILFFVSLMYGTLLNIIADSEEGVD
ncbi:UNKNOWN [Stylonychia lemnae]|uniref:Amino acid transporter transmembrane domain-containing protein n=1 Tax=Stylonychia lemnae TaxID=5949 RepID=A0A078AXS0_STYLE|nr:UNKNOWN [Stylonychia lemnae]|eukprot:CDW86964.1 UNKNOWN [Stylonychia lemnae]